MTTPPTPAAATAALLTLLAGTALAAEPTQRLEISPDGRTRAQLPIADQAPHGAVAVGVPFNATPDYTLNERRPIGGLAIADLNGDGYNDLAACAYTANSFPPYDDSRDFILFGSASGLEATPSWFTSNETHTADIQVGDINLDTFPDLVTIHGGGLRSDSVRVYFGSASGPSNTAGWISSTNPSVWGTDGLLVDVDNDNDLDVVTTNQGASTPNHLRPNFIFTNNAGVLESDPSWESSVWEISNGVAARDITGDGFPELAFAKWVNFVSGIHLNTTGTPDTLPSLQVNNTNADKGAVFMDVEGDGPSEVVFGGEPTTVYATVHGFLDPLTSTMPPFDSISEVEAADVDLDGDDDLLEVHFADGRAHLYLNNDGVLDQVPSWTFDATEVGNAIAVGDLNNDGTPDLAIGYAGNTCIRVFYGIPQSCPADYNGDDEADFFDISAFLMDLANEDPRADINEDNAWDFFDISAFLAIFADGCP
jgi:hypothetical protein